MNKLLFQLLFFFFLQFSFSQSINEDFEANETVNSWAGDDCQFDVNFSNPQKTGINQSNTVLKYNDVGGSYANIYFTTIKNFDLTVNNNFSFKIYVSSSEMTGNQNESQVSLKLQNKNISEPWTTQAEIIKSITLDTWQTVTFDFENGAVKYQQNSDAAITRTDFNKVLIQVNGENNNDLVIAYIDDFFYDGTIEVAPETEFTKLVWSDEFDGNELDKTKWFQQIEPIVNGIDWANNEEQHYTNLERNSYVENGSLFIKAIKENYTYNGAEKSYTSARLNSKYFFKYGRVEVRAKLPAIAGTWPAIWLLGKNIQEVGTYFNEEFGDTPWPYCGEIDIMEPNIAKTEILGTWHWHNGTSHTYNSKHIPTNNQDTSQNYHIYSLTWDENSMKIFMDDILINEMETFGAFTNDFFILLNVAMGGSLGGSIDNNFQEEAMEIDYVRVYQKDNALSVDNDLQLEKVTLYPNPVNDYVALKVPASLIGANVSIYSTLGQKLESFVQTKKRLEKNLSHYKRGVYFIRFETEKNVEKYSIIKK